MLEWSVRYIQPFGINGDPLHRFETSTCPFYRKTVWCWQIGRTLHLHPSAKLSVYYTAFRRAYLENHLFVPCPFFMRFLSTNALHEGFSSTASTRLCKSVSSRGGQSTPLMYQSVVAFSLFLFRFSQRFDQSKRLWWKNNKQLGINNKNSNIQFWMH